MHKRSGSVNTIRTCLEGQDFFPFYSFKRGHVFRTLIQLNVIYPVTICVSVLPKQINFVSGFQVPNILKVAVRAEIIIS